MLASHYLLLGVALCLHFCVSRSVFYLSIYTSWTPPARFLFFSSSSIPFRFRNSTCMTPWCGVVRFGLVWYMRTQNYYYLLKPFGQASTATRSRSGSLPQPHVVTVSLITTVHECDDLIFLVLRLLRACARVCGSLVLSYLRHISQGEYDLKHRKHHSIYEHPVGCLQGAG